MRFHGQKVIMPAVDIVVSLMVPAPWSVRLYGSFPAGQSSVPGAFDFDDNATSDNPLV